MKQAFNGLFDLHVQVFLLDGDSWIQTGSTSKLTLKEQNENGRKKVLALLYNKDNVSGTIN